MWDGLCRTSPGWQESQLPNLYRSLQLAGAGPDQHPEWSRASSGIFLGRPLSGCLKNLRAQQFPSRQGQTNTPSLQRGRRGPGQPWPPAHPPALFPAIFLVPVGGLGSCSHEAERPVLVPLFSGAPIRAWGHSEPSPGALVRLLGWQALKDLLPRLPSMPQAGALGRRGSVLTLGPPSVRGTLTARLS